MNSESTPSLENRMTRLLFSSGLQPGAKITERDLARNLGLSRIPIRETLAKLVSRGALVKNARNGSVHLRDYSPEEVMELFEMREAFEVAAARLACKKATEADLLQMEIICEQMEAEIGNLDAPDWADLDRLFHETLVQASQNSRLRDGFSTLLGECHYIFYRHPTQWGYPVGGEPEEEETHQQQQEIISLRTAQMKAIVADHRNILQLVRARKADEVQELIRNQIGELSSILVRAIVSKAFSRRSRRAPSRNQP